jgi:hypothetical protein
MKPQSTGRLKNEENKDEYTENADHPNTLVPAMWGISKV